MADIAAEFADHGRFERVDEQGESTDERAGSPETTDERAGSAETTGEQAEHAAASERSGTAFAPTTNDWDATVVVEDDTVAITVTVPAIDAVVIEDVADVVAEGWFDTFERRVEDADGVTLAEDVDVTDVSREGGDVTVELTMTPRRGKAADDALALVNFVEGTWFQGIIPGYDYVETVQAMRERAARNAQSPEEPPL